LPDDEISAARAHRTNGNIRFAPRQVGDIPAGHQFRYDAGIGSVEFGKPRGDHEGPDIFRRGHANFSGRAQVAPKRLALDRQHRFFDVFRFEPDRLATLR